MKIRLVLLLSSVCYLSCSSQPPKNYAITKYKEASTRTMLQADRLRQQGNYLDALSLYQKSENYALKRNDRRHIGLSKLKRAHIYLKLENISDAKNMVSEVQLSNQVESLNLDNAIKFLRAKILLYEENKNKALTIIKELETYYKNDIEKYSYYVLYRWNQDYNQMDRVQVQKLIDNLIGLYNSKKLENIEVLSFALFADARWAVNHANLEQAKAIIERSIAHFSTLELSTKIAESIKFAADLYKIHGKQHEHQYYQSLYQSMTSTK